MVFIKGISNGYLANKSCVNNLIYPIFKHSFDTYESCKNNHPRNFLFVDYPNYQTKLTLTQHEIIKLAKENLSILKENNFYSKMLSPSPILILKEKINNKEYTSIICELDMKNCKLKKIGIEQVDESKVILLKEKLKNINHSVNIINFFTNYTSDINKIINSNCSHIMDFNYHDIEYSLFTLSKEDSIKVQREFQNINDLFLLDGNHNIMALNLLKSDVSDMLYNGEISDNAIHRDYNNPLISIRSENNIEIGDFNSFVKTTHGMDPEYIINKSEIYFDVVKLDYFIKPRDSYEFLIYMNHNWFSFKLKPDFQDTKNKLKNISYFTISDYFFKRILCITENKDNINYKQGTEDFIEQFEKLIDSGTYKIAVYCNRLNINEVKEIQNKGLLLPKKSFYTYPKIPNGLIIKEIFNK